MAEQVPSLPGADRIRAIQDHDGMFKAFDSYPWTKDKSFLSGLHAILGGPNASNARGIHSELALHARIFYYAQRVGVNIDFSQYKAWLADNPDHNPPSVLPEEYLKSPTAAETDDGSSSTVPAWQATAPKADLYVDKKGASAASSRDGGGSPNVGGEPAYPMGFAEMLQRLQKGESIPGIREIPDTVVRDPAIKPFGSRSAPKKPWERDAVEVQAEEEPRAQVDASFPPLEQGAESANQPV